MARDEMRGLGRKAAWLAAGAAALLLAAGGLLLPAGQARALGGSITITARDGAEVEYDAYRVFAADVRDEDGARSASHVKWPSDGMRDAVLAFLLEGGYGDWLAENGHIGPDAASNPQNAAEFACEMIALSADDADAGSDPPAKRGGSFAHRLAQRLAASGLEAEAARAGTAFTGPEGLYLFVTRTPAAAPGAAGTSALWAPLGPTALTVAEKAASPTLSKRVRDNSSAEYGKWADANAGEDMEFLIETTLPRNIGSYARYRWKIEDALPEGMELAAPGAAGVSVTVGGEDITARIAGGRGSVAYAGGVLSVDIADILALASDASIPVSGGCAVSVGYRAHLVPGAAAGAAANTVAFTHTADPVSEGEATDAAGGVALAHSYTVILAKVDKSTREPLAGARFTMQVAPGNPAPGNRGKYIQGDGTLADAPHEFETGAGGTATIPNIDSGIYTLREAAAPDGYEIQDADITLTVAAAYDDGTGELSGLSASVTGGEAAADDSEAWTRIVSADKAAATVTVETPDDKDGIALPLTGLSGDGALYLAAACIASASAGAWAVGTRKRPAGRRGRRGWDAGRRPHGRA